MKAPLGIILCAVTLVYGLMSCTESQQQFEPEFNKENLPMTTVVVPHKNRRAVNEAYNDWVGSDYADPLDVNRLAWATWTDDTCTIHVNVQRKEANPNEYLETLGHEMAHCLYGRFHD